MSTCDFNYASYESKIDYEKKIIMYLGWEQAKQFDEILKDFVKNHIEECFVEEIPYVKFFD